MTRRDFLTAAGGLVATAAQHVVGGNFMFHGQEAAFA